MPTKRIHGVYCSTDSARLVATAPTEPLIALYCNRNGRYFESCGNELALLNDEDEARLWIEVWFGRDSTLYHDEFETETRRKCSKQIGKRVYNLNTATLVASSNKTALYRKRNGEYFLHDEAIDRIRPIAYNEASEWTKSNLSHKVWELEFGPIPDDDTEVFFNARMRRDTCLKLDRAVARTGKTKEQILRELIDML